MIHIIDGNNLAGKLKMLGQINFDRILTARLADYYRAKKISVLLVFDGRDEMGDKKSFGKITIYYSPQDRFYNGADDKIIELVNRLMHSPKDNIKLITSDRELSSRASNICEKAGRSIEIISSEQFADKLISINQEEWKEKEDMPASQAQKINQELLKLWTKH